jgi:hypothetical protein
VEHLIASGRDCNVFLKYIYIANVQKLASEHLACLFQVRDVILAVGFQYSLVIE